MGDIITFRDLEAWQLSMKLVEEIYRTTATFPKSELYGLTSQVRRAAVSIPSNVAEGHCRPTTGAYAHHVGIAMGSHGEVETCVEIAARLGFLPRPEQERLLATTERVGPILNRLHHSLELKIARQREENDRRQHRY